MQHTSWWQTRVSAFLLVLLVTQLIWVPSSISVTAAPATPRPVQAPLPVMVVPPDDFVPRSAQNPLSLLPHAPLPSVAQQSNQEEGLVSEGKPVTAGSQDALFPATNANDGDFATQWNTDFDDYGEPTFWRIDLGQAYTVTKLVGRWISDINTIGYAISVSDDDNQYTDVVSRTTSVHPLGNTNETVDIFEASGRYLRIAIFDAADDSNSWPNVIGASEFKVYALNVVPPDQLNPPKRCPCNAHDQTNDPVNTRTAGSSHLNLQGHSAHATHCIRPVRVLHLCDGFGILPGGPLAFGRRI